MKNIVGNIGVSIFGIATFLLTVIAVVAVNQFTDFNFFTLSFFVVVPAGALLCGAAAASGYYFGSLLFHTRPTVLILIQILVVAAIAQFAIYYGEYRLLDLENGRMASDVVSFSEYLDIYLSHTSLRVGRAGTNTGDIGDYGRILAFIQFLGFVVGGVFVWLMLRVYPVCEKCGRYLRTLAKKQQIFSTQEDFTRYYDNLFEVPVDGPHFAQLMKWQPGKGDKIVKGTIQTQTTLRGCPNCHTQRISQEVKVCGDKEFRDVPQLTRHIRIPDGIDLKLVVKAV
ncbi:hypothetical protein [Rhizobium phaseoli]|uniref:hypothetical protein n=1 Tax=Rhizobium phaseoli TaxID=396 RepID=UPI001CED508E|nr:hypothetical protein [Rhizobium phaseoli]MDK4730148.1 hypothetical protein [Rhizobium phaseoli]